MRIAGSCDCGTIEYTFEGVDRERLRAAVSDFDGETEDGRLERPARTWIPDVTVREGA